MKYGLVNLLYFIALPLMADSPHIMHSVTGEQLSIQKLASGELWGSFYLSDQTTEQFASHELILLQVDSHKPIKLARGLRSCGAPAGKPQQVDYLFEQSATNNSWSFNTSQPPKDVLKLLGWDAAQYDRVDADIREIVVDFPIRDAWLLQQIETAKHYTFRFVTSNGEQHQIVFDAKRQ